MAISQLKPLYVKTLNNYIKTALPDYKKLRLMIVAPENKYRSIVCQGIISSTLFNLQDRVNNSPFSISSWSMRPLGHNYEPLADNMPEIPCFQSH